MVRRIEKSDKEKVLAISSQIWEGGDYIEYVFDDWVEEKQNIFAGYFKDDQLIGFGRMCYLDEKNIWLEALRKDSQINERGVGYKIVEFYFNILKNRKIESIRFSTYFANLPSIKLNENLGFKSWEQDNDFLLYEMPNPKSL